MTNDIITAVAALHALRPAAAAISRRLDDGHHVDGAEIQVIYEAERVAGRALAAAVTAAAVGDLDRRELDDACSLIAAALSGVGDLSQRWDHTPAAHEALYAHTVEAMLAAGHDPDEIAATIAADRADN